MRQTFIVAALGFLGASNAQASSEAPATVASAATLDSTILIIAPDEYSASTASLGLLGYGIPFENLLVPQAGVDLPKMNSSTSHGNYGGIIAIGSVAYDYNGNWHSALTDDQWTTIYAYQAHFNIRMVRINEWPGPSFGTSAIAGGCCGSGVEQLVSITDASDFATANIRTNAGLSTIGLFHVPATITDSSTTRQVAEFGTADGFSSKSVAAVINNFNGREQFVWFLSWAPDWSQTSAFLQHTHIHWMTRGLFLGKRKIHLNCQIDDVQLSTGLYHPNGTECKIRTGDLDAHVNWQVGLNSRLPAGHTWAL